MVLISQISLSPRLSHPPPHFMLIICCKYHVACGQPLSQQSLHFHERNRGRPEVSTVSRMLGDVQGLCLSHRSPTYVGFASLLEPPRPATPQRHLLPSPDE